MENASKALIIAGAILISIMIISLGILIFSRLGGSAKDAANMDEQEIAAFNSKITPYLGKNVAGSQVNALLQYCLSSNISAENAGESDKKNITVTKDGVSMITDKKITRVETNGKYYTVKGTYSDDGLLTVIEITQN